MSRAVPGQKAQGWGEEMLRAAGMAETGTTLTGNPSASLLRSARYPRDPCNKPSLELLCRQQLPANLQPRRQAEPPIPLLGCPQQNPPGLPGSSTAGTLLRGLCVTIFTVLSDSLLGRLVVSCSGITAFGSGEEKEGMVRNLESTWTAAARSPT